MAGGKQHPVIAEAVLQFIPEQLAAICRDHPRAFRLGSVWPDGMGTPFLPDGLGRFIRDDGGIDVELVRSVFTDRDNGIEPTPEMDSWNAFTDILWVASHGAASPDRYACELAEAIADGDGPRAAFIVGFTTHIAEYCAHFKSQEIVLTTLRPEKRAPWCIHKGYPFFGYELALSGTGAEAVARLAAAHFIDTDESAEACQRRLVAEGLDSLFPEGLKLQRALLECDTPGELAPLSDTFERLCGRALARVFEYTRAICADAIDGDCRGASGGEALLLVRGDLWLRHCDDAASGGRSPDVARLRLAAILERAGIDYHLASGHMPRDYSRFESVISLEGWPCAGDSGVYLALAEAAAKGTRVLLLGEPHPSRLESSEWRSLTRSKGVSLGASALDMADWTGVAASAVGPSPQVMLAVEAIGGAGEERQKRLSDGDFLAAAFAGQL